MTWGYAEWFGEEERVISVSHSRSFPTHQNKIKLSREIVHMGMLRT